MTQLKIDLHSHTTCSDGSLTPEELVLRADNLQVNVLAITDHDTIDAIARAHKAIEKYKLRLRLISGVEISTSWHGQEIHIVGLKVDESCPQFKQRLAEQADTRRARAERYAKKLENCGVENPLAGASRYAKGGSISRVHFAKYLVERGYVASFDQAFSKYLGKNGKAYVAPGWISIEQAISWIRDAGGISVLAHPTRYDLTNKWVRKLVRYFAEHQGQAIEVGMARQSPNERIQIQQYANELNLTASVGSDFHFISRYSELGRDLKLPDSATPVWHDWPEAQLSQ
ncbi:PHP domain-containing protein [Saccharobesus litoralis]|uniref:PHP domain-containing protein n=1 Tax=Saccharobesus litoralis TaxID=2172099 RepID=A0A2S0VXV5_9ALTE|nr:PHP domain-containing protein [Saccharobesus litoralis]AWB69041.1 PHP domain-containing protein [Saccharobesus litoralis]